MSPVNGNNLGIAMLSVHSHPLGELGTENTGGMSVYIRELARELGRAGHTVDIYTRRDGERHTHDQDLYDNVRLIHLGLEEKRHIPKHRLHLYLPDLFSSLERYRVLRHLRYDVIHSHYWLSGRVGNIAQHHWGVPHVLMFHTTGMMKRLGCAGEKEPYHRLLAEKRLAAACSRVIAPTQREKDALVRYYGVDSEQIGVIPCGVNLDRFRPADREASRRKLGLEGTGPVILCVARFAPVKGLERLVASMAYLRHVPGPRLIVVGGDGSRARACRELRRIAQKGGARRSAVFAGRVDHDDLPLYYNAADVLAVPSYYESSGLVALESLACGTPVVATDVGAMNEIIQEGRTGAVVKSPGPLQLAGAIGRFIRERKREILPREEIRESVTRLSWSMVAARTLEEYRGVVSTGLPERKKELLVS